MAHQRRFPSALALVLSAGVLLAGCGQPVTDASNTGGRDVLYFADNGTGLPVMYVGEAYSNNLSVAGGAGPYTLRVVGGTLPPGVRLSGQQLSGTPTTKGTYKFTLEVTDSTLSTRTREYTVNVNELPPLSLAPTLPGGEIRGETRIPVTITAPRTVRAARLSWQLPEKVTVTRVQATAQNGVLFWQQAGRMLTVDVGFRTVPRSGERIALISVKPEKTATLTTAVLGYEARDGDGKLLSEKKLPEPPRPAATPTPQPAPQQDTAPPTDPAQPTPPAAPTDAAPRDPAPPADPAPPGESTPPDPTAPGTPADPAPGDGSGDPPSPVTPPESGGQP